MNDDDAKETGRSAGTRSLRLRAAIYGERQTVTVRMGPNLNKRLMEYCGALQMPANIYITGLICGALLRNEPETAATKRLGEPGETKVTVTIRLDPKLHMGLTEYCKKKAFSANTFICGLIHKDLAKRDQ